MSISKGKEMRKEDISTKKMSTLSAVIEILNDLPVATFLPVLLHIHSYLNPDFLPYEKGGNVNLGMADRKPLF